MKRERLGLVCAISWFVVLGLMTFPCWVEIAGLRFVPTLAWAAPGTEPCEVELTPIPTLSVLPKTPLPVSDREVLRGRKDRPYVALTFDADSSPKPLSQLLTTMNTKGVSCTFFIQGDWAERFPDAVQSIVRDGHEIGNHSYSHPDFRELTEAQIIEELALTENILFQLTGITSRPFFRPPYSYRNDLVRRVAAGEGYLTVIWTYDAFDWKRDATEETIYTEIVGHAEPGAIYVQHVGDDNSASVLARVIDGLRAEGLEPVKLSTLLAQE